MNKLREFFSKSDLHEWVLNYFVKGSGGEFPPTPEEYEEEYSEKIPKKYIKSKKGYDGEKYDVINYQALFPSLKYLSDSMEYVDGDPYDVVLLSFQEEFYRIRLYHDSYGEGERLEAEGIRKGKMVSKVMEVFEEDDE